MPLSDPESAIIESSRKRLEVHHLTTEDINLFLAIKRKDRREVLAAIESGANLNCLDESTMTPLMVAAELQLPEIVELLLDAGADPTLKDKLGYDAEAIAAWYGEYRNNAYTDVSVQIRKRLRTASDHWRFKE